MKNIGLMPLKRPIGAIELVGGHPALDFVNTVSSWGATDATDYLGSYEDFLAWCQRLDLFGNRTAARLAKLSQRERSAAFKAVLELRDSLHNVFAALATGRKLSQPDLDVLNKVIRRTATWRHISVDQDNGCESICCVWDFKAPKAIAALGPVAWLAADLLENGATDRIKECPGRNCAWIFMDSSRNRSRHWCSMKTCGNVAKVRRFRRSG